MKKINLTHVVLYSKGFYHYSDSIWEDMKKCLSLDNYNGEYMSNNDILYVIIENLDILRFKSKVSTINLLSGIHPSNTDKFGYITNSSLFKKEGVVYPDYNYEEAILKYCLSVFRYLKKDEWDLGRPDFDNCLPKCNRISMEDVENMFESV